MSKAAWGPLKRISIKYVNSRLDPKKFWSDNEPMGRIPVLKIGAMVFFVWAYTSCMHSNPPPAKFNGGSRQNGTASWYGADFHGKPTASGEIYNMNAFTAAHRSAPFNTMALVTNLANKKRIKVRINDRGPFVSGRIIDLSQAAAAALGMMSTGTAEVQVEFFEMGRHEVPAKK